MAIDKNTWELEYTDQQTETVDVHGLNERLQRRWGKDYAIASVGGSPSSTTHGEAPPMPAVFGGINAEKVRSELITGVHPEWTRGRWKYDPSHYEKIFTTMVAAHPNTELYSI